MSDNPQLELGDTSRGGATIDEINIHNPNNVSRTSGSTSQPEAETTATDGLGTMFSVYLKTAREEDKKMTDSWKGDANGILVFTGLFSAVVASFLLVANQSLQPSSQDTSAFYLAHIYQVTAAGSSNAPVLPLPPNLSDPSTFIPSSSAIWVNVLWFMSLITSLTCALLATLLQQWARRYLQMTGTQYGLHKRARIRAFFAEGLEKRYFPWAVEALPSLLHTSVFLFFAGLPIFQFGINRTVFALVVSCVGASGLAYLLITFMPLVFHDSPYYTPLSNHLWLFNAGIRSLFTKLRVHAIKIYRQLHAFVTIRLRICMSWQGPSPKTINDLLTLMTTQHERLKGGLTKEMEMTAQGSSWEIDARALSWAFDRLDEERDLEKMLAAVPDFFNSALVKNSKEIFSASEKRIPSAILQLMNRSFSSSLIGDKLRDQRSAMCVKILEMLPELQQSTFLQSLHFICAGNFKWTGIVDIANQVHSFEARCVTTLVTAQTHGSDERLSGALARELGVSEPVLKQCLTRADNLRFFNFLDFVRWLVLPGNFIFEPHSNFKTAENVLNALREFDATTIELELQHKFCALWNVILRVQAQFQVAPSTAQTDFQVGPDNTTSTTPWGPVAQGLVEGYSQNLSGYRLLIRLVLDRIAVVYVALHPTSRASRVPTDVWDEDDPREPLYPRCDDPNH